MSRSVRRVLSKPWSLVTTRALASTLACFALASCGGATTDPSTASPDVDSVSEEELVSFHGIEARSVDRSLPEVDTIGYDVDLAFLGEAPRELDGRTVRTPVFAASVTVTYVATSPLSSLVIDFKKPRLAKVTSAGKPLAFAAQDDEHVRVSLGKTVRPGTGFKLTYTYEILPKEIDARETEDGGLVLTSRSVYSASWPRKGRFWLPLRDAPRDGAMFAARLTFPSEYTVVSNGVEKGATSGSSGTKTWSFELLTQVPTYAFFVGASKDWVRKDARSSSGVPVPSWMTPASEAKRDLVLDPAIRAIGFLESTYGPFPFPRAGFVEAPTTWGGGGMEHATVVAIDPTDLRGPVDEAQHTAIHELCHHYSGDGVRIDSWADFWLSEGFTEYLTHRAMEAVLGKEVADARWTGTIAEARRTAALHPLRPRPPAGKDDIDVRDIFDGVVYVKGAWVLRTLEKAVGRARFDAFLKGWFTRHMSGHVTTEDLRRELEGELGTSFTKLFDDAVYGTALPE